MAAHRKLAADFGHQADAVGRAARERSQRQEKPIKVLDRFENLSPYKSNQFFRTQSPLPLPISTRISVTHRTALSNLFLVRRVVSRESKASSARARRQH